MPAAALRATALPTPAPHAVHRHLEALSGDRGVDQVVGQLGKLPIGSLIGGNTTPLDHPAQRLQIHEELTLDRMLAAAGWLPYPSRSAP